MNMKKGEIQRAKIINIAIEHISEKGIAATSFQKIADELGISQSGVFHYFKNKTQLFLGVMDDIVERNHNLVNDLFTPTDDTFSKIKKHCMANFTWLIDKPAEAKIVLYLYQQSSTNPGVRPLGDKIISTGRERLIELISKAQEEGAISSSIDSEIWGRLIHEFLTGGIIQTISLYEEVEPQKEAQNFEKRLTELLNTLKA